MRTEIIIRATRTQIVLGEKGRRIRELTSLVQKRFKFPENSVDPYAERVNNRGLCAIIAQAESLRYKLLAVRRACYGAKGCETSGTSHGGWPPMMAEREMWLCAGGFMVVSGSDNGSAFRLWWRCGGLVEKTRHFNT
ncbi:putative K domain, type 2, K domain superfamily, prokaryotic type, K domain-like, alpha/beta protein [Helianthus annuus]|nr:putative K domain, type 2, K domain superfamily, prokaryotic type, K domain-like, alpha/beta protein [Helianthus annuus]KAJ0631813.1 putative K domain, type 2, K domain superfamily, prokaryotic type, K domain-like, alpha/beta protein [Helianthus annuus]